MIEKQVQDPKNRSKLKIFIVYIVILWVCAVSFALTKTLSIEQVYHAEADHYACGSTFNDKQEQIYTILKWIIAFVFPYTIIIVFSCMLLRFLKEWSNNANALLSKTVSSCNTVERCEKELLVLQKASVVQTKGECKRRDSIFKTACCFCFGKNSQSDLESKNTLNSNNNNTSNQMIVKRMRMSSAPSTHINRVTRIKQRSTRFVLAVVFSFLCTWSPLWVYQIILIFTEFQSIFLMIMHNLTLVITYVKGVLDPLFFLLLTENFREFLSKRYFSFCKKSM